jgi:hypothetical protein
MNKNSSKTSTSPAAVIRRAKRDSSQTSELSFPAKNHVHGIQLIFKEYSFAGLVANGSGRALNSVQQSTDGSHFAQKKTQQSFFLPFPTSLQDSTGLNYNNFERDLVMSVAGEAISSQMAQFKDKGAGETTTAVSQLQNYGAGLVDTYTGTKGNTQAKALAVANKVAKDAGNKLELTGNSAKLFGAYLARNFAGDISKTIAMDAGQAINPSETLSFEGVDLKSYTFDWDLYPESKEDSDRIKQIIKTLKRRILPTTSGGGFGESAGKLLSGVGLESAVGTGSAIHRMFLRYPDAVYINLIGVDPTHFPQFKPAMCTGMDVDYGAAGSMVIAKGGRPAAVNISLSFSELVIHTAEDYGEEEQVFEKGSSETPKTGGANS